MGGIRAPVLVLLLALGSGVSGWAATSGQRDQHAKAIAALIAAGMRLPAERQFAEFQAARYPSDDASLVLVLRLLHLDRFSAADPTADRETIAAELKRLREQVSRLQQTAALSAVARAVLARGSGTSTDLVNAIARIVHPDDAPPIVPLATEKSQRLREHIERLITVVETEFQQAVVTVQAHEAADLDALDLPDGSAEQLAGIQTAVERRLAALRPLRTGMLVLREVVARGNDYGIDPTPVRERLRALFAAKPPHAASASLVELLADWDFTWGEISPVIGEWCGSLLGDALILGLSTVPPDEVDRIQRRTLALDPRHQREVRFQVDVLGMQVRATTDAMRWRLQRGDGRGLAEAWQLWQEFGQRAQQDQRLVPGRSPHLGADIARLHLIAARTAVAMGNRAEAGMVLQRFIASGPPQPFDGFAKHWLTFFKTCELLVAEGVMNPADAIILARALLTEAKATSDVQVARHQHLTAAAILRSGLRGLSTLPGDERTTAEHLAQLYHLYVMTLHRLEMRHHAAIAALAGTDQALRLIDRLGQQKQPNPWKNKNADGRITWDDSRITPMRLATDGMIIASQLKARDPGMNRLYLATIERLKRLEPSGGSPDLRRQEILSLLAEEDYAGALREAAQLLRDQPDSELWVAGLRNQAIPAWAQRLRIQHEQKQADDLLLQLARDNAIISAKLRDELARSDLPAERRAEVERTQARILVADIESLTARQHYDEAMTRIIDLLGSSTGDAAQTARWQARLAQVAGQWVEAQQPTIATSVSELQAIAERLERIRTMLQSREPAGSLSLDAAKRLALAYHRLRSVLPATPDVGNDALARLVHVVDRGFAETFAVTIDDQTPAGNLVALANTWRDLGEPAKAIAPYERYVTMVMGDPVVMAFLQDRRAWLAPHGEVLAARGEFRTAWNQIVSACVPAHVDQASDLRTVPALVQRLKRDIDGARAILGGEPHLRLVTALGAVDAVVRKLLGVAQARQRLVECLRASGRPEAAMSHLQWLCAEEPDDGAHRLALVLVTQEIATRRDQPPPRAELEQARLLAARIRDERQGTTDKLGYWEASVLVLEFSLLLGDHRLVEDTLAFMGRNRSDLSRDLVAPPVVGDDRRVRRALGTGAVALARRFLGLYGKPGISTRPPFRIEQVESGNGLQSLFVDSGTATPVARMVIRDEHQVLVFVVDDAAPSSMP